MSTQEEKTGTRAWDFETLVLLGLLVVLPAVMASGFTAYEALKTGLLLCGGGLLAGAFAVRVLRSSSVTLRGWLLLLPVLGLSLMAAVSALWAPNAWYALKDSAHWFALGAIMLVALSPSERPVKLTHVAVAVSVGAALASIVGLLQVFGVSLDTMGPSSVSDGLRGSFDHERYAAITLACGLPLMAAGLWLARKAARIVVGISMVLVALYVGACGVPLAWIFAGSGAVLGVVAILIGRGGAGIKAIGRPLLALGVAAVLVAVGALALDREPEVEMAQVNGKMVEARKHALDPLSDGIRQNVAVGAVDWGRPVPPIDWIGHEHALSTAIRTAKANPLVGFGGGNWDANQTRNIDRSSEHYLRSLSAFPSFRMAHSSFLQLAAELGFVGLLLLLLVLAVASAAALKGLKTKAEGDERWLMGIFGLIGTVDALFIACALGAVLELAASSALFAATLGLLTREALSRLDDKGVARPWAVGASDKMEKWGLALAPALLGGLLALGIGMSTTISDYYKARGDVWLRAGSLDDANTAYDQALSAMPGNDLALFNKGNLSEVLASQAEAENLISRCLTLRPHDPRLFSALGHAQMREAARRGRDKWGKQGGPKPGEKMDPSKIDPSKLFEFVDRELMNRAILNFNRAKDLHPRYILAYERLSNAYMVDKKVEKSQIEILKALEQIGDDHKETSGRLHHTLAQSYMVDQDWGKAEKHLMKSLEADPGHSRRDAISRDLAQIEARREGKKIDPHGHGHEGPRKPGGLRPVPNNPKDKPHKPGDGHKPDDGHKPGEEGHEDEKKEEKAP